MNEMVERKGIDVSDHQGIIDWDDVRSDGITFAMLRMGYGSDIRSQDDEYFHRNVRECERVGIPWGAYLYSYALDVDHAKSEVDHALRLLKGKQPDFPVAFDMEDGDGYKEEHGMPSNKTLVDICVTWLEAMEDEGYYVSLYANRWFLNQKLRSKRLKPYDKWVAEWDEKCSYNGSYLMWQYRKNGEVKGILGNVDMDIAYSDFNFITPTNKDTDKDFSKYFIQYGDTLSEIAESYNTSVERLMEMNPQINNKNIIRVGQVIDVPSHQKQQPNFRYYAVKSGDTLSEIAINANTDVNHLMRLNPKIEDRDLIYPGQKIKVPVK